MPNHTIAPSDHVAVKPARVIVKVDQDLSDLVPGFLDHKRADISAILGALARGDYAAIGSVAHRIKGEGGSYGFAAMTEMGRALEAACTVKDGAAVTALARELLAYLDSVDVVFVPSED